jgi:thiamine-phosphate pyrophosphorylase
MKLCYVTDRKALAGSVEEQLRALLNKIENAGRAGVDWIQIREKDLSERERAALVNEAIGRVPRSCRVLVNDRLDVAIAVGAGGVHLGEQSITVLDAIRLVTEKRLRSDFLVGVSTHSLEAARVAEKAGADYVIFGPVFATPSKAAFGPPQGLENLREICARLSIPVMAIGGVMAANASDCLAVGAAGIAAIRLFQDAADMTELVRSLRKVE